MLDQLEIYAALCVECLLTTWDNAAVALGNVLNQVRNLYNDFGQQTYSIQDHSGAVTGASPRVIYSYADGSQNTIRMMSMNYPNGRLLSYDYGTAASRIEGQRI